MNSDLKASHLRQLRRTEARCLERWRKAADAGGRRSTPALKCLPALYAAWAAVERLGGEPEVPFDLEKVYRHRPPAPWIGAPIFGIDRAPAGTEYNLTDESERARLARWIHPGMGKPGILRPLRPMPSVARREPTAVERLLAEDARKWPKAKCIRAYAKPGTKGCKPYRFFDAKGREVS